MCDIYYNIQTLTLLPFSIASDLANYNESVDQADNQSHLHSWSIQSPFLFDIAYVCLLLKRHVWVIPHFIYFQYDYISARVYCSSGNDRKYLQCLPFCCHLSNTQFWPYPGRYKHQFTRPGIYYYWSGPVDSTGIIVMRGKVNVTETFSQIENVTVRVGEYEAVYNVTGVAFSAL